ncbi:MAG TPA: ABC transporter ATP-binding protein [Gemmatimonadales bacterium]|nr:ABC transporter ATP-binding protein [Gemmatimonadales bacterium]
MAGVTLREVVKAYGDVVAVDRVSLEVEDGEFVALVGPSGCGKTTTLNLVAGLIDITGGEILLGDRPINNLDPKDRDLAMVFQNYALYPNKTVFENLAFPLRMRKVAKSELDAQVKRTANVLSIDHLLDRHPRQLSGGQQQRVALGRALVRNPKAFLMDEPLSNLDAKLRVQMRAELKRFHLELNATVIYVTHDQLEAVTMADRIAVMHLGVLQQYATPDEIYNRPLNTFVAGFIGSPAMNLMRGRVTTEDDKVAIAGDGGWLLPLADRPGRRALSSSTGQVIVGVRHGHIQLSLEPRAGWMEGRIYTVEPTGDLTYVHLKLGDHLLVASNHADFRAAPDAPIWVMFDQDHLHLFDADTEQLLEDAGMPLRVSARREAAAV